MKEAIGLSVATLQVWWEKSQAHVIMTLLTLGVIGFILWLVYVFMMFLGWTTGTCIT